MFVVAILLLVIVSMGMVLLCGGSGVATGSVVYGPSTYFDNEPDTTAMLRAFDRLEELALSPEESVWFIDEEL